MRKCEAPPTATISEICAAILTIEKQLREFTPRVISIQYNEHAQLSMWTVNSEWTREWTSPEGLVLRPNHKMENWAKALGAAADLAIRPLRQGVLPPMLMSISLGGPRGLARNLWYVEAARLGLEVTTKWRLEEAQVLVDLALSYK